MRKVNFREFYHKNQSIQVHEEIKSLMMGQIDVPDPMRIGKTKPQAALVIAWAVVYSELQYMSKEELKYTEFEEVTPSQDLRHGPVDLTIVKH